MVNYRNLQTLPHTVIVTIAIIKMSQLKDSGRVIDAPYIHRINMCFHVLSIKSSIYHLPIISYESRYISREWQQFEVRFVCFYIFPNNLWI